MKMKKFHLSMNFAFPLPTLFWFPKQIFWEIGASTQFFKNFISLLQKKGWDWEGVENYMYSSKNLYNVSLFFSVI